MMRCVLFFLVASSASVAAEMVAPIAGVLRSSQSTNFITLDNGYVSVTYDTLTSSLSMGADFSGEGSYKEVLSSPYKAYVKYTDGDTGSASLSVQEPEWLVQTEESLVLRIPGISDTGTASKAPLLSETWTLSLTRGQRSIGLDIKGITLRDADNVAAVYHGLYMKSSSIYGLFDDRGMAQMMNKTHACLGSEQTMTRAYSMGNGVAMDYVRHSSVDRNTPHHSRETGREASRPRGESARQIVLSTARKEGHETGIEDIVLGSYPDLTLSMEGAWGECWVDADLSVTAITAGTVYSASVSFIPNDYDFPAYLMSVVERQPRIPFTDLRTHMTGIYGSPAGCLQGYFDNHQGTIAPTISHPDVGYSPDTNFFDPDNFIALSALMYSGDSFFLQETRRVLERTSNTMCGLGSEQVEAYCSAPRVSIEMNTTASALRFNTPAPSLSKKRANESSVGRGGLAASSPTATLGGRDGQLMHHFVELIPTYESIAGSEQLGPNVFWTWTCLRYISLTQDFEWAITMFPYLDLSIKYLLTFYDESRGMIFAPGPLWIDVLVRENYTSDSNAIMVPFLQLAADAYEVLGPLVARRVSGSSGGRKYILFADELRAISTTIALTMASELWDSESNDHFITQLDPSGVIRDFVDYDSNLLAVAFGAVSLGAQGDTESALQRANLILGRVDSGDYTHVRATWCSEIPYSGDACDCYIVGGDVCGDSVVTLARIGWADSHARKLVGDIDTFDSLLLAPLQEDLVKDVWLYERYDDTGEQIRTSFYFEYPSIVAMMLREIRYGLTIGLDTVDVNPFLNKSLLKTGFLYSFGDTYLAYSSTNVEMRLPSVGQTTRSVAIHGLVSDGTYLLSGCAQESISVMVDEFGVLQFKWTFVDSECRLTVSII